MYLSSEFVMMWKDYINIILVYNGNVNNAPKEIFGAKSVLAGQNCLKNKI